MESSSNNSSGTDMTPYGQEIYTRDNTSDRRANYTPKQRREAHEMAMEACLLSYKMHLDTLKQVEKVLLIMRKRTNRKVRGKFADKRKAIAKTGQEKRSEYWQKSGAPVARKMEESYERLLSQLMLTNSAYPELAQEGRAILATLARNCEYSEEASTNTVMGKLLHSWNEFVQKLGHLLDNGAELLPNLQSELQAFRTEISVAIGQI